MKRKAMLWSERSSWVSDWLDLVDYLSPYSGRFVPDDANKGDKTGRAQKMLSTMSRRALKSLAAGLMGGMTSPARPWFRLTIRNAALRENQEVKRWLQGVTDLMREIFARSNFYRALHQAYMELGAFGTTVIVLLPDFDNIIHCTPITVGEYALATDHRGRVNTIVREFNMTVGQMVRHFGVENCSLTVQNHFKDGNLDQWILVHHHVEPREWKDRDPGVPTAENMAFKSCYYEAGKIGGDEKLLLNGGHRKFPALAARWDVNGNDVYGTGPGHDALGDMKESQFFKSRRAQAIDYMTNPPLQGPSHLKTVGVNRFPGGFTWLEQAGTENTIKSLYQVNLDLQHLQEAAVEVAKDIKGHFYEDLFLMLANDTRSGITATEVAERHEEKLLMLGPVLERLHNELLDPAIEYTFDRIVEAGLLVGKLAPPKELSKVDLQVQYVSMLAQAQRAVGLQSFDRLVATIGALAGAKQDPGVWDKLDSDQLIDEYADGLGVTPSVVRSDDDVEAIRAERAAQAQAVQQAAMAQQAAETAATASQIDTQGVQDVMGMFSGYSSPTPVEAGLL